MKIESIIRRAAGTTVTLGEITYRFKAGPDGKHVCEVKEEANIDRLLSIKEGFRALEDQVERDSDNTGDKTPQGDGKLAGNIVTPPVSAAVPTDPDASADAAAPSPGVRKPVARKANKARGAKANKATGS